MGWSFSCLVASVLFMFGITILFQLDVGGGWKINMMELSHSLTLNEEALQQLPPAKRPIFVFEWLRFLDKVLEAAHKVSLPTFILSDYSLFIINWRNGLLD